MHNLAAGLFTQAVAEIGYMVKFLGGTLANVHGLPGVGDLYVTCLAGRNSRMGRLLGLGLSYQEAKTKHMADDTVEGADLALAIGPTIELLIEQGQLEPACLPLAQVIIETICQNKLMQIPWTHFLSDKGAGVSKLDFDSQRRALALLAFFSGFYGFLSSQSSFCLTKRLKFTRFR
jgi:glycerol-3-phosphate dehydrogenase (NAD(P)+)